MRRRPVILFGATGRLGRAIAESVAQGGTPLEAVGWTEVKTWARGDRRKILSRLAAMKGPVDIIFAGGLTDPAAAAADLMFGNVELPTRVIQATADDPRYRYLTIGSVLETFAGLVASNAYLASKAALSVRIHALASDRRLAGRIAHLRMHTLYGGAPAPHSFLGQMHESLREHRPFRMSEGRQVREYWHIADAARSIVALLARDWRATAVRDLSTGEPVMLRELALAVFRAFACEELLQLGALPTPSGENMERHFPRAPAWLLGEPRAPIPGIIDWLSLRLGRAVPEGAGTTLNPSRA